VPRRIFFPTNRVMITRTAVKWTDRQLTMYESSPERLFQDPGHRHIFGAHCLWELCQHLDSVMALCLLLTPVRFYPNRNCRALRLSPAATKKSNCNTKHHKQALYTCVRSCSRSHVRVLHQREWGDSYRPVFLNRRTAARYRALASNIPGRERFSWNLSF